jgi:hypothetical protein
MRAIGFIATGLAGAAVVGTAIVALISVSDVRHYFHIRKM